MHDVVIIGAGSAGAALATRLSEDPGRSVLLIEAGPDYPDFETLPDPIKYGYGTGHIVAAGDEHDWSFVGRGTDLLPEMAVPRGRVTGGTSAINGQIFLRGIPEDYDGWAAAGSEGWSYENVLPFFKKLESDRDFDGELHGSDGPIPVVRFGREEWLPTQQAFYESCLAEGFPECPDHNDPASTGVGAYPRNNPDGIRMSTALTYLDPARDRENLTILPETLVRRVVFDGDRATGVEIERDGQRSVVEGHEIVLSAGAVGSPHLLLLSGVGPADQLGDLGIPLVRDLPGVGQNLQDHPVATVSWDLRPEFRPALTDPYIQVGLRYTAVGSSLRNDMFVVNVGFGEGYHIFVGLHGALSRGELRLVSDDVTVQPSIDFRYFEHEEDRRRIRDGVRLCVQLGESPAYGEMLGARLAPTDEVLSSDSALDDWIAATVHTGSHISCVCKMGPASDPMAVVDEQARVHGVHNLRVADASIMPTLVRANTNASTIMIGERIAGLMAG